MTRRFAQWMYSRDAEQGLTTLEALPMTAKDSLGGIRFKLSAVFMAVSLIIAGFVIGAINIHLETIERAALLEAEQFVGVVAYAITDNALQKPEYLQKYVDRLRAVHGRDLVFVDVKRWAIADADKHELGAVFNADPNDEVGQTIRDGRVRTFIERNVRHPDGVKQIVVPLRESERNAKSAIVGAAIVEYSSIYDGLLASEEKALVLLGVSGIGCVLLSMIFGLHIAAKMAGRLKSLQNAVDIVAEGNYETKVPIASRDEIGRLGAAFNTMAGALKNKRDQVVEHGRLLEERVASGTEELKEANILLWLRADEHGKAIGALSESEERYRKLFELSPDGMLIVSEGKIVLVNRMCMKMLGATVQKELIGTPLLDIFHSDYRERARERMLKVLEANRPVPALERKILKLDGTPLDVEVAASPFTLRGNPSIHVVMRDITDRKEASDRLNYLAQYDSLTGLPNRSLFQDRLEHTLLQATRSGQSAAVLFIDLDRFKIVNDTLGHASGDKLLQQVAARLTDCIRAGDTVGRFGGDEFGLILLDLGKPGDAGVVAQKINDTLARPFDLDGHRTFVTASVGITLYPADATDARTLKMNADAAMYRAKDLGRNTYQFFTQEMNDRAIQRMQMEASMRQALERSEFVLHYQPKVDLASGSICGVEALLRWAHPEKGLISPAEFVPVLEETGLIVPVGEWVIREACAQIGAWQQAGLKVPSVAVNLSARQFQQKNLDGIVREILRETGVAAALLQFEITESLLMTDPEAAARTLLGLKKAGVMLSVDDFGTGHSSLAYLKRFPLDVLKIDRTFINDIVTDPDDAAITIAIINLAHSLKLKVVAEGVETEEQLDLLALHSCDEMQGFYFSRPVAATELEAMLRQGRLLPRSQKWAQAKPPVLRPDDKENDLLLLEDAVG
jgi:diguanylate cyclase (GGDEF)-like protein/PAS domain S-box-containing protein